MMRKRKTITRIVAALLAALLILQGLVAVLAAEDGDTILISDAEDLLELAENCRLDSWSRGKTVIVQNDISLSGYSFDPIPTFGGTFDGGGYTISGLTVSGAVSPAGLFGILQEGAVVKDLTVSGTVSPGGGSEWVGGIAGENHGTIENCTFTGTVSGRHGVGGIVGLNAAEGTVRNCQTNGNITGRSMTGGIAGRNPGVVTGCRNESYVNVEQTDPGLDLEDIDLEFSQDIFTISTLDTVNVATDTGGIAGYSSGMVLNCVNTGTVGYPHIGYNVGGIAGRSSGHISSCENHGEIRGRKDIGGIAGQAEPYIVLELGQDTLADLRTQLDVLEGLINQAVSDAEGASNTVSARLSTLNSCVNDTMDQAGRLSGQMSSIADDTVKEINRGGDIAETVAGRMADISGQLPGIAGQIGEALAWLERASQQLADAEEDGSEARTQALAAAAEFRTAQQLWESGTGKITAGLQALRDSFGTGNTEAEQQVQEGTAELSAAMDHARAGMEQLFDALDENPGWSEEESAALAAISDALGQCTAAMNKINSGMLGVLSDPEFDGEQFKSGIRQISAGMKELKQAGTALKSSAEHLDAALKAALDAADDIDRDLSGAAESMRRAVSALSGVSGDVHAVLTDMADLMDYLAGVDALQLSYPESEVNDSVDALFNSADQISAQLDLLNGEINQSSSTLTGDLRAINSQFMKVMDLLIDAIYEAETVSVEDVFLDTSLEDIDAAMSGKVWNCVSHGNISGDINVGGVAGAMAIEHEFDPEDDLETDGSTARREYRLKAIIQNCSSDGTVTARTDYAGGLCGRADLGVIIDCEAYGTVKSERGDYVGGAAGYASGTIRECWIKCALSGRKYIGGVVGALDSTGAVTRCRTLVTVSDAEQYAGAIAGADTGSIRSNWFVSEELAGLDRVSAEGRAEPITYEQLYAAERLPDPFRQFTLRFYADGKEIKSETFRYGDSLDDSVFPAIPEKDGYYAQWDTTDLSNLRFDTDVHAVYTRNVTALASDQRREDGRSVFFLQGEYTDTEAFSAVRQETESAVRRNMIERRELVELWDLTIPDDGADTHTVRYLSASGRTDRLEVWQNAAGEWEKLETSLTGSYLVFDVTGASARIAVVDCFTYWWVWAILAAVCILLLILLLRKLVRNLRRRRAERRAEQERLARLAEVMAAQTGSAPADTAPEIPLQRRKKRRKWPIVLAIVLVLAVMVSGIVLASVTGTLDRLRAYRLIDECLDRDELLTELNLQADVREQHLSTSARVLRTKVGGERVTCIEQYGASLSYCGGYLYLEDGRAYHVGSSVTDYSALLEELLSIVRDADISVFENSGETIYSIRTGGEDTGDLLEILIPGAGDAIAGFPSVTVDLVRADGKLTEVRFSASGKNAVSGTLDILSGTSDGPTVPTAVRAAILNGEHDPGTELTDDLMTLLGAWMDLNARDPLTADIHLTADCGPLVVNDDLELLRTCPGTTEITCIRGHGRSVYFTDTRVCDESGNSVSSADRSMTDSAQLLELAYQLCLNGRASCSRQDGASVYRLYLDEDAMDRVVETILPQAGNLDGLSGDLEITVSDRKIRQIHFECSGSAEVLFVEAPVSLTGDLMIGDSTASFTVPDAVRDALEKGR